MKNAGDVIFRWAGPEDYAAVLALNEVFVDVLSPLDLAALTKLHSEAAYFRVVEVRGKVAAFLIAMKPQASYGSDNYQWFESRYDDFIYIDRIVVAAEARGMALGPQLYNDLGVFAAGVGLKKLVCEYNIQPMNEVSMKFHQRYGFAEVGQLGSDNNSKRVSMQSYELPVSGL